jgi:hypothetical protein
VPDCFVKPVFEERFDDGHGFVSVGRNINVVCICYKSMDKNRSDSENVDELTGKS